MPHVEIDGSRRRRRLAARAESDSVRQWIAVKLSGEDAHRLRAGHPGIEQAIELRQELNEPASRIVLPLIGAIARDAYVDLAAMDEEIRQSTSEWTIGRPPKLNNKALTGKYRTTVGANVPRAYAISRADTAHAMLAVLDDPATIRQAVGVAY